MSSIEVKNYLILNGVMDSAVSQALACKSADEMSAVLTELADKAAAAAWNRQQARIDELMLEYCPEEMTPAQLEEWRSHQRAVQVDPEGLIRKVLGGVPAASAGATRG